MTKESWENRIREVVRNQLRQEIRDNGEPSQAAPVGNLLWAATAGFAEEEHDCHTFERITLAENRRQGRSTDAGELSVWDYL